MKSLKLFSFPLSFAIAAMFILSSCSMEKRTYMSGYNVDWKTDKHFSAAPSLKRNAHERRAEKNETAGNVQALNNTNTADRKSTRLNSSH